MKNEVIPNRKLASVCGLYCGSCGVFIATQENDIEKLQNIAKSLNQTYDETLCDGCGAERKSAYCKKMCTFIKCAEERNIEFCGQCNDYPCVKLKDFQSKMPHRIELWKSQERLKEVGWQQWSIEMKEHYTCSKCNTINSAYNINCRKCGNTPSCNYTLLHKDEVIKYLTRI